MKFLRTFTPSMVSLFCIPLLSVAVAHAQSRVATVTTINPTFTTIDVPGAMQTVITGINSAGEMVGWYSNSDSGPYHSFLLSGGNFTFFDYPGAVSTVANGINDSGLIVGYEGTSGNIFDKGFTYDGTNFTPVMVGQNTRTFIFGINNAGDLAGTTGSANQTRGFVKQGGSLKAINFPGPYTYAYATGINNLGQTVGYTVEGSQEDSYLYAHGKFRNIDVPGASLTAAFSINDSGLVVGYYLSEPLFLGFVLRNGKYSSFGYLAFDTFPSGVSASGQIVGSYTSDEQTYHGFVTSPLTAADCQ